MKYLFVVLVLCLIFPAGTLAQQSPPDIIIFNFDAPAFTLPQLESGEAFALVEWKTVGVEETHILSIEVLQGSQWWRPLSEDAVDLPPEGGQTFQLAPPLSFALPTFRLAIRDEDEEVIAQRILTMDYAANEEPVAIATFELITETVSQSELARGQALIEVEWEVSNRVRTSQIFFEQVLSNGEIVNIELPRLQYWIESSGRSVVAPVPDGAGPLNIRLRVMDLVTDELYAEETELIEVRNNIIPTATRIPPTATPTREPTEVTANPAITEFVALVNQVTGEELKLGTARVPVRWNVTNRPDGTNLVFEQVSGEGFGHNIELPRAEEIVPSSGQGIVAPFFPIGRDPLILRLSLVDEEGNTLVAAWTNVLIVAPFGDDITPTPPPTNGQPFIASFVALVEEVTIVDGSVEVPLAWSVWYLPAEVSLLLEQVDSSNNTVGLDIFPAPIDAYTEHTSVIAVAAGTQQVGLRLTLLDDEGEVLDEATLEVPVVE
ncbi:MAG: hypothetical protein L0154_13830 [Chloroflexi bacterium]|nr:hypothetical protein [Chloroflexota bacterium]